MQTTSINYITDKLEFSPWKFFKNISKKYLVLVSYGLIKDLTPGEITKYSKNHTWISQTVKKITEFFNLIVREGLMQHKYVKLKDNSLTISTPFSGNYHICMFLHFHRCVSVNSSVRQKGNKFFRLSINQHEGKVYELITINPLLWTYFEVDYLLSDDNPEMKYIKLRKSIRTEIKKIVFRTFRTLYSEQNYQKTLKKRDFQQKNTMNTENLPLMIEAQLDYINYKDK
jgi:hypothetical protein